MAYALFAGRSKLLKDKPTLLAKFEFNDLACLMRLEKTIGTVFLQGLCNFFDDSTFSHDELVLAKTSLLNLLPSTVRSADYDMVCRLLASIEFALDAKLTLFGISD